MMRSCVIAIFCLASHLWLCGRFWLAAFTHIVVFAFVSPPIHSMCNRKLLISLAERMFTVLGINLKHALEKRAQKHKPPTIRPIHMYSLVTGRRRLRCHTHGLCIICINRRVASHVTPCFTPCVSLNVARNVWAFAWIPPALISSDTSGDCGISIVLRCGGWKRGGTYTVHTNQQAPHTFG